MIEAYIIPAIVFALGILTLVNGTKKPKTTVWKTLLLASVIIWNQKGAIEMLLFLGLFTPLLYISNLEDTKAKKSRHSSIQEKATAYLATLPAFGFYFLFRERIETTLSSIKPNVEFINNFEVLMIILTLLAIFTFLKVRGRRC